MALVQDIADGTGVVRAISPRGETFVYKEGIEIIGVLHVQRTGVFIIAVRADYQRRGIKTALLKTANEDKPIDFSKSSFSLDGEAPRPERLRSRASGGHRADGRAHLTALALGQIAKKSNSFHL